MSRNGPTVENRLPSAVLRMLWGGVTDNIPRRKPKDAQIDVASIHRAVDDALKVLVSKGTREEDFDLKVELALRTIRDELQKMRKARERKP